MAKRVITYAKLMQMAADYCVDTNPLFISAARTYCKQMELIGQMQDTIAQDGTTTKKEYVKGRENVCCHPLVEQIPKHTDSANRTLQTMLTIITSIGHEPVKKSGMQAFIDGDVE